MTLYVIGSMTSTVPAMLLGTYTRCGSLHSGQGTAPDMSLAYTLKPVLGRLVGWMSGGGSRGACWSSVEPEPLLTGGAVHTTSATTAAGLTTASAKTPARKTFRTREGLTRI